MKRYNLEKLTRGCVGVVTGYHPQLKRDSAPPQARSVVLFHRHRPASLLQLYCLVADLCFRPWAFAIWKLCKIKVDLSFCCNLRPMNI
ncbi:hypothetical protein K1719_045646 [Acacia pycnantha]|nr:hypothetical protein K1719_045646 [Acacia pycnantha]